MVSGLALDSRKVKPGDLFLAAAGGTTHGLEFARQAVALGATAVAWQPVDGQISLAEAAALLPVPAIAVPDLGLVVGRIADRFYGHPSHGLFVIAVTGTDGKTSCSHFIAQALDRPDRRCGLIGTLGCGLYGELSPTTHTTPDALTVQSYTANSGSTATLRAPNKVELKAGFHAKAGSHVRVFRGSVDGTEY